jgi:hypothetical protein
MEEGIAPFNPSINEEAVRKKLIKPEENWIMLHIQRQASQPRLRINLMVRFTGINTGKLDNDNARRSR